jgi:hypothetical protein
VRLGDGCGDAGVPVAGADRIGRVRAGAAGVRGVLPGCVDRDDDAAAVQHTQLRRDRVHHRLVQRVALAQRVDLDQAGQFAGRCLFVGGPGQGLAAHLVKEQLERLAWCDDTVVVPLVRGVGVAGPAHGLATLVAKPGQRRRRLGRQRHHQQSGHTVTGVVQAQVPVQGRRGIRPVGPAELAHPVQQLQRVRRRWGVADGLAALTDTQRKAVGVHGVQQVVSIVTLEQGAQIDLPHHLHQVLASCGQLGDAPQAVPLLHSADQAGQVVAEAAHRVALGRRAGPGAAVVAGHQPPQTAVDHQRRDQRRAHAHVVAVRQVHR